MSEFKAQEPFMHSLYEITVKRSSLKRYISKFIQKRANG